MYFWLRRTFGRGAADVSIFLLQPDDNNEEGARSPSSPVTPDARCIFGRIFGRVVFLPAAPPMLVFFLLQPDNDDEEEVRSQSSPVAPDARRIFGCVVLLAAAPPMIVFFLLQPNDDNEEEARSPSSPVAPDSRRIFGRIFGSVVFLANVSIFLPDRVVAAMMVVAQLS